MKPETEKNSPDKELVYTYNQGLKNYFEFQSGMTKFEAENAEEFLQHLLEETVKFTKSKTGYIFQYEVKTGELSLLTKTENGGDKPDFLQEQAISELIRTESITGEILKNEPVIINKFNSEHFEADRICLMPLSESGAEIAIIAIAGRSRDYAADEADLLKTLLVPGWSIYKKYMVIGYKERLNAQAAENTKLKDEYMMNVSHEIRTPVNAIVGFSNLLAESEQALLINKKYLNIILDSSDDLLTIINDFEEISNLSANLRRTIRLEVNVKNVIDNLFDHFSQKAIERGIVLIDKIDFGEQDSIILTDPAKLNQILTTLISTALKFTFSGRIEIGCRLVDGKVEFKVSDTGRGIPKELQANIFKYFSPDESILAKKKAGAGIGLAISYTFVRHLGGDMWFTSGEGEGSVFWFTLPAEEIAAGSLVNATESKSEEKETSGKKIILVAEDDNNNFSLVHRFLGRPDIEIIRACDGKEAVDICASRHIDLVLMDIKMPVMDGYTATRIIRESKPELKIIAQTAYISERNYALSCGCTDFIAKPFRRQQLISMVNSYI